MFPTQSRLAAKFALAGALVVVVTIACGAFCATMFARFSRVIGEALEDRQQTLDLAAELAGTLEREDDALLLAMTHRPEADPALAGLRSRFEEGYQALDRLLTKPAEREALRLLRQHVDSYRRAGDQLARVGHAGEALKQYHQGANLLLRQAIADCRQIREATFLSIQHAGSHARDEARRAIGIVLAIVLVALLFSIAAAVYLARLVVRPVLALTESVDALRRGEFGRRVRVDSRDELGQLAEGFNRMADTLDDFRRSNLGEVLRAKAVLEATLEALPDAILVTEADGRLESMNRLARALLLGSESAPLPGSVGSLPLPARVKRSVRAAFLGELQSLPPGLGEAFQTAGPRWLLPIVVPQAAAERYGAILVLHDVTEFVRLDELRGEVVALTSHELKTPLTTLHMNLMLLCERIEDLNPRQRELVTTALSGSDELRSIIERLLDVARIEAGQLHLTRQHVELTRLIREVAGRFRERAEEAGLSFQIHVGAGELWLTADAARLGVVLSNLLTNAFKYTPRGGAISVSLTAEQAGSAAQPAGVRIAVTDSGPGIPPELRERVFEKFYRIEHHFPERDHGARGAGLGLYLCRQVLLAHGGTIGVHAGPGDLGTQVQVTLPWNLMADELAPEAYVGKITNNSYSGKVPG